MITRKQFTDLLRWIFKTILMSVGLVVALMPFIPAFKEYFLEAPEKEFGAKEVLIFILGLLLCTGAMFSNKMLDGISKIFLSKINKNA